MTRADVPSTSAAILADSWGDRRAWFRFAVRHPGCTTLVADVDGAVVGTAVVTHDGPAAWIGTIWVAPAHRGAGIGRTLTEASVAAAEARGAVTLLLVATDEGRRLYERLGFGVESWYVIHEATGRGEPALDAPGLRAYRPADLAALRELDRAATGEDRAHLLAAMATPDSTRVAVDALDRPVGYLLRPPFRGGATIAVDPRVGLALVEDRRRTTAVDRMSRCGVLLDNTDGSTALRDLGWTEAWRAPRLRRGPALDWHPERIWGQFSFALG
jgi:ribosomal protein S18 acetylase RimI-like enzyme